MKSFVYNILFLISGLFCICSCSNEEDIPLEYEEFSTLDLGEGTYRPNPFPFLDNLPPFSWMGMPDSVKLKTTLQIGFNEDAIRSTSTAKLAFLDNNGNIVEGLTYDGHDYPYVEIDASDLGYDQVAIVPIEITVDPSLGNRELNGSIAVFDADVDVVNQQTLTSSPQAVASWSLTQHTGINWLRWLLLIIIIIIIIYLIYWLIKGLILVLGTLISGISGIVAVSTIRNSRKQKHQNFNNLNKNKRRNPFIEKCERILINQASVSDKAVTLERLFNYWDYELPEEEKTYEGSMLDSRVMKAMDELWDKYYRYTKKNMTWSNEPHNSRLIPNKDTIPANRNYSNIDGLTWGQIMDKYKYKGLMYHKGKPNFAELAIYTVTISDFDKYVNPDKDDDRGPLQERAFELMATKYYPDYDVATMKKIKEDSRLVWHEDTDCKTLYLVPQEIHNNLHHFGGIGMLRVLRGSDLV